MPGAGRILGVDVGGTFTDFLVWERGGLRTHKVLTTPAHPDSALRQGLAELDVRPDEVVHGTTLATNALLERKGARTALLTTAGFRDVLEIGRQARLRLYDLHPARPEPIVPRALRLELHERVAADGRVERELDEGELEAAVEAAAAAGVEAVAISFLFSFLHPGHEQRAAAAVRARGLFASASHEILPEYREYERTSTTVINATLSPLMARYLARIDTLGGRLRVMGSDGGSLSAATASTLAVRTVLSGPAGGVVGAFAVARAARHSRVITLDMGGTSTDVSLCPGRILFRDESEVGGLPIRTPTTDLHTVGAGGGSLARIDAGGALHVGPESAGADPGPACYGRGTLPTVADAHVLLGRLHPAHFLGGRMRLHPERSRAAFEPLTRAFGDEARAALAVVQVANANMARAVRVVSVERGYDPRAFTLVAFGGAGPLHACELAEALNIPRVLIPRHPGVLSALGMATAPVTREAQLPILQTVAPRLRTLLQARVRSLTKRCRDELTADGYRGREATAEVRLSMRYAGQSFELPISATTPDPDLLRDAFHRAHRQRYGHSEPARPVEVVGMRVRLSLPPPRLKLRPEVAPGDPRLGRTRLWFGRWRSAPLLLRERLRPGHREAGPALIVQMDATTVVPPGWSLRVDGLANLVLEPR